MGRCLQRYYGIGMKEVVLVPKDRIGVINKDVRKELKEKLGVECKRIENAVEIDGEGLELLIAKNIIKAIARGFSPIRAYRLMEENAQLEIIDLSSFSESRIKTIKSRIIGTSGKTREAIEHATGAYVSVYGKTVSLIGNFEQIKKAREAIDMLISGAMHKSVYRFLEQLK